MGKEEEIEKLKGFIRDERNTIHRLREEIERLNSSIGYAQLDLYKYKKKLEELTATEVAS